jgi:hypothetical protein
MTQTITSAGTSIKQVPAILNKIVRVMDRPEGFFAYAHDVLDMGGGKYDLMTEQLAEMNIRNWVLDPFNRSEEHNAYVVKMLTTRPADFAICSNVLNVVREFQDRQSILRTIKMLSSPMGLVFFTVYEGDGTGKGKKTTKGWQENRPTASYLRELKRQFGSVTLCNNKLIVCEGFKP